jgi:hypothetical protein
MKAIASAILFTALLYYRVPEGEKLAGILVAGGLGASISAVIIYLLAEE